MQGPDQLPDEGQTVTTYVGTGLKKGTKVKAKVHGVHDDQIAFEVLEIIEEGSGGNAEIGDRYGADPNGFYWEI